jgi:NIMA (never in mitosis gene a)-related kinase
MALGHIHSKNILHRDLKPKNIMLTSSDEIKIGDFGISKMLENTFDMAKTATGTPYYLSPEVCLGQKYDHKSDCWMLGCILHELCTLRRPFEGDSLNTVLNRITKTEPARLPKEFDPLFQKLVDGLLQKNAQLRSSTPEILEMPEIKENILRMKEPSDSHNSSREATGQNDHLSKIHYIQPMSQKKHSELNSSNKVKANPFVEERQSSSKKGQFQGEITFGDKANKFADAANLYNDFMQQEASSAKHNRVSYINTDIDNQKIYRKRQFNSKTPNIA